MKFVKHDSDGCGRSSMIVYRDIFLENKTYGVHTTQKKRIKLRKSNIKRKLITYYKNIYSYNKQCWYGIDAENL